MKTLFTDMSLTINSHCTIGMGCLLSWPAISGVLVPTERSCLRLRTSGPGSDHNWSPSGGSWLLAPSSVLISATDSSNYWAATTAPLGRQEPRLAN